VEDESDDNGYRRHEIRCGAMGRTLALPEGTTDKWFAKAGVDAWEDMPADTLQKCIEFVKNRLPQIAAA